MSHEAGNQRGKGGGSGGSKAEISLKKDQWSRLEKRLIELKRGGGDKLRTEERGAGLMMRCLIFASVYVHVNESSQVIGGVILHRPPPDRC